MKRLFTILFIVVFSAQARGQEVCTNGLDDDADGLIDLNDPDCDCNNLIDLSLIPNPSFEDTLCCPFGESMLSCAGSWVQASDATSDYYNLCDFAELPFEGAFPPGLPLPGGGEGFAGLYNFLTGYREYVGVCTTGPLLAGISYSINFHSAYAYGTADELEVHIYGTPNCAELPWEGVTCPDGIDSWTLLGAEVVEHEMDGSWVSTTISFTPLVDLYAISLGATCGVIGEGDPSYFYFDELILLETETMGYIEEVGGWCSEDLILNAETDDPGGSWQWFKDGVALMGETSSAFEPFPYGEGAFTALYTYAGGCKQIHYTSPAIPEAIFDFENVCFGEGVSFENSSVISEGEIEARTWKFGDGNISNIESPVHLYASPGTYFTELIIYSEDESCHDTATAEITVFAKPVADFSISGDGVSYVGDWLACANNPLSFTDLTTIVGSVSFESWDWDFGNGDNAEEQHPEYVYPEAGAYDIKLIVIAENGCVDSVEKRIVLTQVVADFINDTVCFDFETSFQNLSYSSDASSLEWWWEFGDETDNSYAENPTHLYLTAGNFEARLVVQNALGCRDSLQKNVVVHPKPTPDFYASQNPTDYFNTDLTLVMIYPKTGSSFQWFMPGAVPSSSVAYGSVSVVYPQFIAGDYEVILIETSEFGCVDSVRHIVRVMEDQMIFAPNAFTPNGDPFNQDWGVYVEGFNPDEFRLTVFNPWGETVWETTDAEARWDGTYLPGVLVPDGVYAWYVKARDQINDEVFEYNGFVTVLK